MAVVLALIQCRRVLRAAEWRRLGLRTINRESVIVNQLLGMGRQSHDPSVAPWQMARAPDAAVSASLMKPEALSA